MTPLCTVICCRLSDAQLLGRKDTESMISSSRCQSPTCPLWNTWWNNTPRLCLSTTGGDGYHFIWLLWTMHLWMFCSSWHSRVPNRWWLILELYSLERVLVFKVKYMNKIAMLNVFDVHIQFILVKQSKPSHPGSNISVHYEPELSSLLCLIMSYINLKEFWSFKSNIFNNDVMLMFSFTSRQLKNIISRQLIF